MSEMSEAQHVSNDGESLAILNAADRLSQKAKLMTYWTTQTVNYLAWSHLELMGSSLGVKR